MVSIQRLTLGATFFLLLAGTAEARKAELLPKQTAAKLRQAAKAREKVSLPDLALGRASLDTIELEPMDLWAPDAKVFVHGARGTETLAVGDAQYFRGQVKGDPQSAVFLSVSDKKLHGLILSGDKRFTIGSAKRADKTNAQDDDAVGLRELEPEDDPSSADWKCDVDGKPAGAARSLTPQSEAAPRDIRTHTGAVANASYTFRLAIETDYELYSAFKDVDAVRTYIENLVGNASVVFQRDLGTTLTLGSVQIHSAPQDPWQKLPMHGTAEALAELAQNWHDDPGRRAIVRSAVVMVSGKAFNAGRAFQGTFCGADFSCGADGSLCGDDAFKRGWGGPYAFVATNGIPSTSVADPTVTRDGITYAIPTTNDYWMLYLFTHEVGHLANGPHTNCVQLTYEERVAYNVERSFVDECVSGSAPCFAQTATVPPELGTIMSGCHVFVDGLAHRASRYVFAETGKPSAKMRPIFRAAIDGAMPDPSIRLGVYTDIRQEDPQPLVCDPARTAHVGTCVGCTYAWTITGGTITSGAATEAITYTPTAPLLTLRVTITAATGCAVTASRQITTSCAALAAPASLIASANGAGAISLSWPAVSGAASYELWRTSNGTAWSAVGVTTSTSYLDLSVTNGSAYLYRVRGRDADGYAGAMSPNRHAVAINFTDPVLAPHSTLIRVAHIAELRTAVNALRVLAALPPATFTDPDVAQANIKRIHVEELRLRLAEALTALGVTAPAFTDPTIAGNAIVRTSHIADLRAAIR